MRDVHLRFGIDRSPCQHSHLSLVFCECLQVIIRKGDMVLAYEISPMYRGSLLGKAPVRNFREGAGNVGYGRTRTPLRHRKSGDRKLPTYGCARLCSTRPRWVPRRVLPRLTICSLSQWGQRTVTKVMGLSLRLDTHKTGPRVS